MEEARQHRSPHDPPAADRRPATGTGRRPLLLAALVGLGGTAALAGCAQDSPTSPSPSTSTPSTGVPPTGTTSPTQAALEEWTLEEKVGQLIMVGVDASAPQTVSTTAISSHHVGNIFVSGRSSAGASAVHATIASVTALAGPGTTHGTSLLVATDQEGGDVQVLAGPGFSTIPSALEQSELATGELVEAARGWGAELAAVGVTMNLAPVVDLVDGPDPTGNGPIGAWGRQYGHDATTVQEQAGAFAEGMAAAGVIPTIKHFPGLGRVEGNTDTTAEVVDSDTTRTGDPAVSVFAEMIADGARVVMMSSAVYSRIDPDAPAVFSEAVVNGMLRTDLGFTGVIMTDDLSAAAQLQQWEPGERAVLALTAGCDLVLASGDPADATAMASAIVEAATTDSALAARVDQSVERVLTLKGIRLP
ncbi:MAG: glycoside hydrolase family 3 N-terminal domain-containing protein [Actinomyces sp.]|uniref:glycoside hydrolase family 3 N-terminal domain-containing protein n=1 Tax=Actinomyces sp. TaxID=29317 RepID=UPI0026DD3E6B|nr:glycoside hydrolase family 3 N-terminal domain-containing protein [Actinomyces sp.]MDO4243572.1 glycoside hydrolase family 3 N-terminal domain-containing protein [Actinomyces sp.]